MKGFLVFLVLLIGTLAACRGERQDPATQPSAGSPATEDRRQAGSEGRIVVGGKMPSYSATTLDGRPYELKTDNVVLLNIWATWCGPCRVEIPELQVLHEKFGPRKFEVVGVSIDDPGTEQIVRNFVREQRMTYPVVFDPQGRIADLFQTTVIPTSALIDREGTVLWVHRGIVRASDPALNEALEKAL